ncbi:MAG: UDP-N-acetylglucosamine 2-epimerase (non-hydrolyzing) [Candidatus Nitrosocosmicus sp.]
MKIVSIVGARPNFIKLAPIHYSIREIAEHIIIHTGQHYDYNLSKIFFSDLNIPNPDYNLEVGSNTAPNQIAQMITKLDAIFTKNKFDLVIVYGDTNSTLAGAITSNKTETRLAHVESGLRSFDKKMPEEINRTVTDHISDFLFAPTDTAVKNLNRENISGKIYNTGDISVEVINKVKVLNKSKILKKLDLQSKEYLLLTMHRSENTKVTENLLALIQAITKLKEHKIIFPMHPRTLSFFKKKNLLEKIEKLNNIKIIEPLGYIDFINLMKNSNKIITDSGGIQKESFLLEVPCITIRNSTEWIETVKFGWNLLTGLDSEKIIDAVKNWTPTKTNVKFLGNGRTSETIKDIICRNLKVS